MFISPVKEKEKLDSDAVVRAGQVLAIFLRIETQTLGSVQESCWTLNQTLGLGSVGLVQVQASRNLNWIYKFSKSSYKNQLVLVFN